MTSNKLNFLFSTVAAVGIGCGARAAEIPTNTAQMQAMDKITGRVSVINVPVNSEVRFGSFSIIVRDCRTRPPEETPENFAFVDVADTIGNNTQVNIFKGWMLSSSPALNAVEHPVYDVWLLKCIDTDLSNVAFLNAEELAARDLLPMQRTASPAPAEKTNDKGGFEDINLSGEPIDLLPAAVREAGEEEAAAEDVIMPMPATEIQPQDLPEADPLPATTEEHAPHSLLGSVSAPAETDGNPLQPSPSTEDETDLRPGENTETSAPEDKIEPLPAEDAPPSVLSEETLRELEEELSYDWN